MDGLKTGAPHFVARLKEEGVRANAFGERRVRMVTHFGIERVDIDYTIDVLARLKKEFGP
jgi:threonine aldolase